MRIELCRIETTNLLHGLAKYQQRMEAQLQAIQQEQSKEMEALEAAHQDEPWLIEGEIEGYIWTYDFFFPRSLRYSFIVHLFLTIENQLYGLCDEIKKRQNLPIRAKELSGDAIAKCKTYIQKVAGIATVNEVLWQKIEDLAKVRNCIVHTLGKIEFSNDRKRLHDLSAKDIGISISEDYPSEKGVLLVAPEFCKQAVDDAMELFDEIFEAAGFDRAAFIY